MKKFFFIIISLVTILGNAYAQYNTSLPTILPQTPNSAVLGKFGNYEVSMFTGLPSISIPLYTIKTAGFEVPVTLVYHPSGLKVTDFPSWVGAGWAIDAGGQISRSLNGLPDESLFGFLRGATRQIQSINKNSQFDIDYLWAMNNGNRDNGADVFSYSFPGAGGKFFFSKIDSLNYKPVLMPYAPVNISYNFTHTASGVLSFDLKDVQGNKYQFGHSVTEFSFYNSDNDRVTTGGGVSQQVTAWMLEQMVSATKKDTVNFSYQSQADNTPTERTDAWVVSDQIDFLPAIFGIRPVYEAYSGPAGSSNTSTLMASALPQQISFKNGKVVFQLDATARQDFNQANNSKALKYIKVYSSSPAGDVLLKTVSFFYGYFMDGTDATTKRLRLDSIQVSDAGNAVVNSYRFNYNQTKNLPVYTSLSKDYWGYFNGRTNNISVPQQVVPFQQFSQAGLSDTTINITIGSTNPVGREPDSASMQAGVLTRIYYPTKGYTDFQYEANKYFDMLSSSVKLAGGLRIKSISSYDGVSAVPVIKTYQYGTSGLGRGNFVLNQYSFNDQKNYLHFRNSGSHGDTTLQGPSVLTDTKRQRMFYSNPTINTQPFDGAPVVYPFVTEYIGTGNNVLGKTEYRYRDSPDIVSYPYNAPYMRPWITSTFYERGQLLDKKVYKTIAAGQYQPVEEETNTYNVSNFAEKTPFEGFILNQLIVRESPPYLPNVNDFTYTPTTANIDWAFANYYMDTDDNYPTSAVVKTYDQNDTTRTVVTTKNLAYTNMIHQQPTQVTTVNSKNETLVTNSRYAADYIPNGNTTTGNAVLDTMLARNMNAVEIEKWSTIQKPAQSAVATGGQTNFYKFSNGLVVPDVQNRLKVTTPLPDYLPVTVNAGALQTDSRYEPIISYNLFDSQGNILEVQRVNGVKEAYIWSYNGAYPVAKITGTDYNTAKQYVDTALLYNPATSQTQINSQLTALRNGLSGPGIMVATYTYNPLTGMTSSTDAKGETTYYEYDNFQRLMNIKDKDGNIVKHMDYHYQGQ